MVYLSFPCIIPEAADPSLAIGSPLSELTTLQQRVTAINGKHGPFDACVIVGDLFEEGSDGSELSGIECMSQEIV